MYIKKLRILDTASGVLMREVAFHKGTNLVIDSEDSESHNKVGKTTFLKLIDVLMGAKDRKLIYTDSATNTVTADLQNIITDRKVAAELTLTTDLGNERAEETVLEVELFPRGHYFINKEQVTAKAYREQLNEIVFGIKSGTPTFRQLINAFVRVRVGGDNDAFLRMLNMGSNATYRGVYNYLFKISDPKIDQQLDELKRQLNHTTMSLKRYRSVNGVDDVEQQKQVLAALEIERQQLQAQADDILDGDEYKANRAAIADVRKQYEQLMNVMSELDYRIGRNESALAEARKESERKADLDLAHRFYDEVSSVVPGIAKTFDDMVAFNGKLANNRIAYFEEVAQSLASERADIEAQIRELVQHNGRYLALIANDRIGEYDQLQERLGQVRQEMGKLEQVISTLEEYEESIKRANKEIARYSTGGAAREGQNQTYQGRMNEFNAYFTPLAEKINGEKPILVYQPDTDKFPVSIRDMFGMSTGTRKSLLAAYDLAYQQFAAEVDVQAPHFIVHDVVENIEGGNMRAIIDAANGIDCQYIVAMLKEKLDSSGIPEQEQEQLQIVRLSADDMLFQGRTVNAAAKDETRKDIAHAVALNSRRSSAENVSLKGFPPAVV